MRQHTRESIAADLCRLGVKAGDILFVHSSFKSLGPLDGGAEAAIGAMEDALGPEGLLLLPTFNLIKGDRAAIWDIAKTPSTVGYLTEVFRTMSGTVRSDHYSHSVAARGRGAAEFVAGHLAKDGPISPWDKEPWGRTYGDHSPLARAYEKGGKILMLGVDYQSATYIHYVEVLHWNARRAIEKEAKYVWLDRVKLGEWWDRNGCLLLGKVGDADCRLFSIRGFVDSLLREAETDTAKWMK